jgi:hypothetical protein
MNFYRLFGAIFLIPYILIHGICTGIFRGLEDMIEHLIITIRWIKEE